MAGTVKRFGSFAHAAALPAIEAFTKQHQVAQAAITEVLVVGLERADLPQDTIDRIVTAGRDHLSATRVDGRKTRRRATEAA